MCNTSEMHPVYAAVVADGDSRNYYYSNEHFLRNPNYTIDTFRRLLQLFTSNDNYYYEYKCI